MSAVLRDRAIRRAAAIAAALASAAYAGSVALSWLRYGHPKRSGAIERDDLLDQFMPAYDVVERHQIRVAAPAAITFQAATDQDLLKSFVVRTIFKAREIVLRSTPDDRPQPKGLLAVTRSLGWGVLDEVPGHEIVVGAITKPWEANVTFHALPPEDFATFSGPGYVKIAWTLRADPLNATESMFRTETRAVATDPVARRKFRRYWAFASPGIGLIRILSLQPLKQAAERRAGIART